MNLLKSIVKIYFYRQALWLAQRIARHKNSSIHLNAKIVNSNINGLKSVGSRSYIRDSAISGSVSIGDHAAILDCNVIGNVKIGRYTTFNGPNSRVFAEKSRVTIGNFCSIASGCFIYGFNHISDRCTSYYIFRNLLDAENRQDFIWDGEQDNDINSKGSVTIGHDVWIGAQVVIVSGVSIGTGAIIAANSTVTKDIPPYAIAAGSPAKVVKFRFGSEIIDALIKLEWWLWDDDKIRRNRFLFDGKISIEMIDKVVS